MKSSTARSLAVITSEHHLGHPVEQVLAGCPRRAGSHPGPLSRHGPTLWTDRAVTVTGAASSSMPSSSRVRSRSPPAARPRTWTGPIGCGSAGSPGDRPRRAAAARCGCGPRGWSARRSSGPRATDSTWHADDLDRAVLELDPVQQAAHRRPVDDARRPRRRRSSPARTTGAPAGGRSRRRWSAGCRPSVSVSSRPTWKSRSGRSATQLAERAPALGVRHRRDHAARLVEHQVDVGRDRRQPLAVDPDHRRGRGRPWCPAG